ncbi:hypothetical protein NX722_28555 [Endozoicomonas gorgoniicola]|uniref:Curli production assembly/transport component CsgE n=1 Tax=Endozoicomonas gorgoniicola TaxID=1234144 RepID=A0ABT3N4F9_9GAMM|nr:hypothetical protein [Endozoicomonas gorgoniicola]MCW7556460.1 hypothetical protein [Endozoicomonas gorgoniicola]MCW7556519.1 hypothetical protein [Endozoicomonas gorgoniicola]
MIKTSLLLMLSTLAMTSIASDEQESEIYNEIASSKNGRYVFSQISEMRRDQYMLDTKTGRIWVITVNKDEDLFLMPIPFSDGRGLSTQLPVPLEYLLELETTHRDIRDQALYEQVMSELDIPDQAKTNRATPPK